MPRPRHPQDEILPFPDPDPSGRGGGWILRKISKQQATAYEAACAEHAGVSVATYRQQAREAVERVRRREEARPALAPQDMDANRRELRALAQESRVRWLKMDKARRVNGV